MDQTQSSIVAVDIGNSQIKLGRFLRELTKNARIEPCGLPEPIATLELPIAHDTGRFALERLTAWCDANLPADAYWSIGSVHRGAAAQLVDALVAWSKQRDVKWIWRQLTYRDLPLAIRVEEPARVGIDRLLAAMAANHLRAPGRPAIVVDLGTAITVDSIEADGGFAGGAILPGIGMASRALADQTDALPHVVLDHSGSPPQPLGKATISAIQAGLYWGAVGAVSELISQLAEPQPVPAEVFITGGAGPTLFESLSHRHTARYEPHLVLAGIVLTELQPSPSV